MSEDYARGDAPLAFVVTRLRLRHELSANGSGILASQRIGNPPELLDQSYTPGREPRGFTIGRDGSGRPQLRVWAEGLPRQASVAARFVKGDWNALAAGRPVALAASVDELQRAQGVVQQIGRLLTRELRQRFENAIPFVTIRIGDLTLRRLDLSARDVVIQSAGSGLRVVYPDADVTYAAPVTVGR